MRIDSSPSRQFELAQFQASAARQVGEDVSQVSNTEAQVDSRKGEGFRVIDQVSISDDARNAADAASKRKELSDQEKAELRDLEKRDHEVRTHEAAHLAAAGNLAKGGARFEFVTGPNGRRFAVEGEVQISIPKGKTPDESADIARQAQRAALAPGKPSAQDRAVAARAAQSAAKAEREAAKSEDSDEAAPPRASETVLEAMESQEPIEQAEPLEQAEDLDSEAQFQEGESEASSSQEAPAESSEIEQEPRSL